MLQAKDIANADLIFLKICSLQVHTFKANISEFRLLRTLAKLFLKLYAVSFR